MNTPHCNRRHTIVLALVALLGLLGPVTVSSQAGIGRLSITLVDKAAFPAVKVYLSVTTWTVSP